MAPLAVITMVYNEKRKLPTWLGHYAANVGIEHCYVVDHGTDDGSTRNLFGASRIALDRSPQDNDRRTRFISELSSALLGYYKRVAYVDADELLVADPTRFATLADYAEQMSEDAVTSIGLEIVHGPDEPPLDDHAPVGGQRGTALFSSSMCKTNLIGRKVNWAPGWHSHDGAPRFDDLYLFHLRHADLDQAVERLQITRGMAWAHDRAGLHQRVDDDSMVGLVRQFGGRPLLDDVDMSSVPSPLTLSLTEFIDGSVAPEHQTVPYRVPLAIYGGNRVRLGQAFRDAISHAPLH